MRDRFFAGMAAVAVLCGALVLAGCSGGGSPSPTPPSPSSQSIEVAPPAPESEAAASSPAPADPESDAVSGPASAPAVTGGRVLAMPDEKLLLPDTVPGTQEALTRWRTLARSGEAVYFEVCLMNQREQELPLEDAAAIAGILADAEPRLYDSFENPETGGSTSVLGYDAEGTLLFRTTFMGNWFLVCFPGEEVTYIFDGESTLLDTLDDHIPRDYPD